MPTGNGTANNYRRVGGETADQDQFDLGIDHRFGSGRDQAFGRLSHFRERAIPVTPLPDGSGATTGTLGPQRTRSWALASSYQRTFSHRLVNELRVGDTRRGVGRTAAELPGAAGNELGLPGLPAGDRFSRTLPMFVISGYQQLGSPPNTATDFGTSVTQIADTLTWLAGRHMVKAGADIRWSRLNVVQPPSPTGSFQFNTLFTELRGVTNTGHALASFLLGQIQGFSIDLQQEEIRNRAYVQEYFVQDDWRLSDRVTLNAGVRYTLNFPSTEERDPRSRLMDDASSVFDASILAGPVANFPVADSFIVGWNVITRRATFRTSSSDRSSPTCRLAPAVRITRTVCSGRS